MGYKDKKERKSYFNGEKMYRKPYYVSEVYTSDGAVILFNPINAKLAVIPESLTSEYKSRRKNGKYNLVNEVLTENFFVKEGDDSDEECLMLEFRDKVVRSDYLYLTIMPTEQCNFRCVYCYETFEKGKMRLEIAQAIIDYISKEIVNYKGIIISWFGGEPLLALDIVEYISQNVIEICKRNKKSYMANMTTNGYLLTLETMERLYKCRVYEYQITIDGGKSTHDKQRVLSNSKGTFDVILNNLIKIKTEFRKKFLKITLRTNLTNSILSESMKDYLDLAKRYFIEDKMFDFRFRVAWESPIKDDAKGIYISSVSEAYAYLYKLLEDVPEMSFASEYKELIVGGGVCYAAKDHHYVIGSDGMIYKCTVNFHDEMNCIGKISDDGEFVFYPEKLALWRPSEKIDSGCRKCVSKLSCLGVGCPYNVKTGKACGAVAEQSSYILPFIARSTKDVLNINTL